MMRAIAAALGLTFERGQLLLDNVVLACSRPDGRIYVTAVLDAFTDRVVPGFDSRTLVASTKVDLVALLRDRIAERERQEQRRLAAEVGHAA